MLSALHGQPAHLSVVAPGREHGRVVRCAVGAEGEAGDGGALLPEPEEHLVELEVHQLDHAIAAAHRHHVHGGARLQRRHGRRGGRHLLLPPCGVLPELQLVHSLLRPDVPQAQAARRVADQDLAQQHGMRWHGSSQGSESMSQPCGTI